jgi:hypothetical protein
MAMTDDAHFSQRGYREREGTGAVPIEAKAQKQRHKDWASRRLDRIICRIITLPD